MFHSLLYHGELYGSFLIVFHEGRAVLWGYTLPRELHMGLGGEYQNIFIAVSCCSFVKCIFSFYQPRECNVLDLNLLKSYKLLANL